MKRQIAEVLDLQVPLTAVLAHKTMTLGEILALAPGTVVEFDKPVSASIEVMLHDRPIALGRAVRVGENFGVQVTDVVDPHTVVRELGHSRVS